MKEIMITTPVGRIVQGSLYKPRTQDADGNPLVYKTGEHAGEARQSHFIALAIPKTGESHWNQTPWGKTIWDVGMAGFPQGQALSPAFAWKIIDGDSPIPNKNGKKPCDTEGFKGHWVLKLSNGFAPQIYNENGHKILVEENYVKPGYFVQVRFGVAGNESTQQPGVYLNHKMVSFQAYGEVINFGEDAAGVGFGGAALPPGATLTPPSGAFNPADVTTQGLNASVPPMSSPQALTPPPAPVSYPQILSGPGAPIAPPARAMTPAAQGTYQQYLDAGWSDDQLIQNGFMLP